jgi:hypothetical protein
VRKRLFSNYELCLFEHPRKPIWMGRKALLIVKRASRHGKERLSS